jgi:hypothetical protein
MWTQILRWEGSSHATTETFEIKSQEWRIAWTAYEDEPQSSLFQIYVYDASNKLVTLGANVREAGSAVKQMQGAGRFHLQISSLKSNWVVTIEELLDPTAEEFEKAKLTVPDGDKTKQRDVILRYNSTSLTLLDKKTRETLKAIRFEAITGVDYTYRTADRRHWFSLGEAEGYTQLQLDKDNYRQVIEAFEARTGRRVEGVR